MDYRLTLTSAQRGLLIHCLTEQIQRVGQGGIEVYVEVLSGVQVTPAEMLQAVLHAPLAVHEDDLLDDDFARVLDTFDANETLLPADREQLRAIAALDKDPARLAEAIYTYYRDGDRAARTPRGFLYLHLGLLSGVIKRLSDAASP